WVDAWIPITNLEPLVYLPGVTLVQPVIPVYPVEDAAQDTENIIPLTGPTQSQGVEWSNADVWHAAGYTGNGVSIAIIGVAFAGYSIVKANGDLPEDIVCYPDPNCVTDFNVITTTHGTAVAEIIYDMAPGASLTLATPATATEMAEYIDALA